MADTLTPEQRSRLMRRIKAKDTKPEMVVRKLLHGLGYRYRLHRKDLPGTPDLVFPSRRKVIFVHGCFWHRHPGCKRATTPKTRKTFWEEKFRNNMRRDAHAIERLQAEGWSILIVWECETNETQRLERRIVAYLERS